LVCLSLPVACGDDDDSSPGGAGKAGSGGSAGSSGASGKSGSANGSAGETPSMTSEGGISGMLPPGLSDVPSTTTCGADKCSSAKVTNVYVDPCCTTMDSCGLDTGFLDLVGASFDEKCQPLAQPGTEDASCPDATGLKVPYGTGEVALDPLAGCCREDGTCGVAVDNVTVLGGISIATFGLGCVDGKPFFGAARPCGGGSGGNGAGGAASGGVGNDVSSGGTGPDTNAGGNGGNHE